MAGVNMVCEQGLVRLGLAQKRAARSQRLIDRWLFRVPAGNGADVCARFLSEVYVIGKPLCPV